MRFTSRTRAFAGAALAATLGLAGLTTVVGAPSALAAAPDVVRVDGTGFTGGDRFATAADAATRAYPDADTVVVTTGLSFPDALAAGGLAGANDAPILLVTADAIPAATEAALTSIDPTNVIIVGGEGAVSAAVEAALEADGYTVTRQAGSDRIATAAEVAAELGAPDIDAGNGALATVVMANALNFPDAVAMSPGLNALEIPLLLNAGDSVNDANDAALTALGVEQVVILGGDAAVPESVQDELEADGLEVLRLSGADRFATAVEIYDFHLAAGFDASNTFLATGQNFADALAGGPLAAVEGGAILLTGSLPPATEGALEDNAEDIDTLTIFGGLGAVDQDTEDGAVDAASTEDPTTNATLAADAEGPQVATFNPDATGVKAQTFTFSGLDDTKTYDVAMFPLVNLSRDYAGPGAMQLPNGFWEFRDQDDDPTGKFFDGLADDMCKTSDDESEIVSINGVPVGDECEFDVNPEDGELEVRLTNFSDESDAAFLVVWQEPTSDNDELNLDAMDMPTEPFGIVGPIVWTAGECKTGDDIESDVLYIDGNSVLMADEDCSVVIDPTDEFTYYNSSNYFNISSTEFFSWLNVGDYLGDENEDTDPAYTRTGKNLWLMDGDENERPNTPTGVTAVAGDFDTSASDTSANDVALSWSHDPAGANMNEDADGYAGYCIDRWSPADLTGSVVETCFTYDLGVAAVDAAIQNQQAIITDVPAGTWLFTVYALSAADYDSDYSDLSAPVATEVASGAPKSTATTSGDTDLNSRVTSGDILTVSFDQDMDTDPTADSVTLKDNDGTTCKLTHGGNATFAYSDASAAVPGEELLTITLTGAPVCSAAGSVGGLAFPATVVASSGVLDFDQGLGWNISGSTDVVFD